MITGIKYICPRGTSGYANAAKDYIIALSETTPVTVELLKMDDSDYLTGERNSKVNSLVDRNIEYNKVIIHTTPEFWGNIIKKEKKEGVEIIGTTVWETDRIDDRWVDWINAVDKVIVPCTWNKEVFEDCGVYKPIGVIPHISHPIPYVKAFIPGIEKDDYIFYTIGQWSNRKGVDDTIKGYLNTFTKEDKVCLVVKTFKDNYSESEKQVVRNLVNNIIKTYPDPAKIILLLNEFSDDKITALHHIGDCYVSLCKSEGWGLGAFDAMRVGNPVIITGYGGQKDFVKRFLVNYKEVSVEGMEWIPWYNISQRWAQPDLEHASQVIRKVYNNKEEIKKYVKVDSSIVERKFNNITVSKKLIKFLNEPL